MQLTNKNILLGVTGGIAAYKAPLLVRALRAKGANVQCVLSRSAQEFVTATSLQAVSGTQVRTDLWDPSAEAAMGHIELARWADALLIAPATANCMANLAQGLAPDLLSTLYLATQATTFIAPAMNQAMWQHPATQRNLQRLLQDGVNVLGPAVGEQACGDVGPGRMNEPEELAAAVAAHFDTAPTSQSKSLAGQRVVITAGPTQEAIDPVRYISNHSSGKQGYALAAAAARAGASVVLISGPVHLECPPGVRRELVLSAQDMHQQVQDEIGSADVFIGVAAVADYRPAQAATKKIKKGESIDQGLALELIQNPDIIATVAASERRPFVVGFAAETHDTLAYARAKRQRKGLDMIIVNDVSDTSIGFGSNDNRVTLISADDEVNLPMQSKTTLANAIIEHIAARIVDRLATANPEPALS